MSHTGALDGCQRDGLTSDIGGEHDRGFSVGGEQEYGRGRDHA
jgi:hypothetical protein